MGKILDYCIILRLAQQMNNNQGILTNTIIEQNFRKASSCIRDNDNQVAENIIQQTIEKINQQLKDESIQNKCLLKKRLSESYANLAICLLAREQTDQIIKKVRKCLEDAISFDYMNFWAYFNLASVEYHTSNNREALNNIKCSLSCLYLLRAILSKDLQSRGRQQDLGKAIGLCENNLEAKFVRLITQIKKSRWKMALNELELLEQLIGENQHLDVFKELLTPCAQNSKSMSQSQCKLILQRSIKIIISIKEEAVIRRLVSNISDYQEDIAAKVIEDKMYEFNEIFNEVNNLGNVFGVFQYKTILRQNKADKKIAFVSNLVLQSQSQKLQPKQIAEPSNHNVQRSYSINLQAKTIIRQVESKNGESLFQLTKSHNQNAESLNRDAQLSGNLLSQLQATQKPLIPILEASESHGVSSFNLQSLLIANMRKKQFQIKSIESQIRPLDFQDQEVKQQQYSSYNNHHYANYNDQEEDNLLLNSAYDQQNYLIDKSIFNKVKQESLLKREQKSSKLYPVNQLYKSLEIHLLDLEFKQSSFNSTEEIYCEVQIGGTIATQKFKSKKEDSKVVDGKSKIQWNETLGCFQIPEEPQNLLVKVFKSENDKYFDSCLGRGEIQMTSAGVNKFPIYLNARTIGIVTVRITPSEWNPKSSSGSSKYNSMSLSFKSESQASQS